MNHLFKSVSLSLVAIMTCPVLLFAQGSRVPQPILEISFRSFDAYSSWCKEPIHTRLFADGRLESESCNPAPADVHHEQSQNKTYVVTTKHYRLSADDLKELLKLAEQPDFINAEPGYFGGNLADAAIDITVVYRREKGLSRHLIIAANDP